MKGARHHTVSALLAAFLAAAFLAPAAAPAHTRSASYSHWEITGREARVQLQIAQRELTRLPWGTVAPPQVQPQLAAYVQKRLRLEAAGAPCAAAGPVRALAAPPTRALLEWRVRCPPHGALAIHSELLLEAAPGHVHFARLAKRTGTAAGPAVERVLSNLERRWPLPGHGDAAAQGSSFGAYFWLGVRHIISGADHLVFLLGLLLLAARWAQAAWVVTGFTAAHSITLALAATGQVQPPTAAVEALIGLSVVLVAVENAWLRGGRGRALPAAACALLLLAAAATFVSGAGAVPAWAWLGLALFCACYFALLARAQRPLRLRFALAAAFGLLHGFGFAGVLTELALPQTRLLPALLGFNLGVEAGQLLFAAVVLPPLLWLARRAAQRASARRAHAAVFALCNAAVCAAGVFWLLTRSAD